MPLTGVIILATYSYVKSTCYVTPEAYHTVYQLHDIFTTILAKISTNIYIYIIPPQHMIHMQPPAVWLNSHSPLSHRWGRGITIHVIHGAKHIHAQCIWLHVHVFVYRGTINPSHVKSIYIYVPYIHILWSVLKFLDTAVCHSQR